MATGVTSAVGRLRRARFASRLWGDLGALAALCAGVVVLTSSPQILDWIARESAVDVVTLVAAGVGAATAILAFVGSRLLGEARLAWLAAALVLYCAIVLPWSVASGTSPAERVARLVAYATALVLLIFALRSPRSMGAWGGWVIMLGGGVLSLVALFLAPEGPVVDVLTGPIWTTVLVVGWVGAAVLGVVDAVRRQSGPRLRVGLGLVILAGSQLYRLADSTRTPATDLVFPALRLVGLVVLLVGLLQMVGRGVRRLQEENFLQQEELAVAAVYMERAAAHSAERNHELRNGLAGLAGITHLLSSGADDEEQQRLKLAVLSELTRLHTILDGRGLAFEAPEAPPRAEYAVEPVLAGLVTLRRSAGAQITVDVDAGLRACGDAAVLAQVVTNLLANCDRHAPDAPVTVRGYRAGDRVVVEVRDEGPGLRAALGHDVLQRGVHDPTAGGSGLGLHISAQLLAREGGELDLRTLTEPRGCLATVRLPAADAPVDAAQDRPGAGRPGTAPTR